MEKLNPDPENGLTFECPSCGGFGKRLIETTFTPAPIEVQCVQCNGWGWVNEADTKCLHEFAETKKLGSCLHEYTCKFCGQKRTVDSSD